MGLYEELASKYPVEEVPPLGPCLIVPTSEFKREWESQLKSEGCRIYTQAYGGQVCFFIRKPQSAQPAQPASQPPAQPKIVWTPELIERLKQLRAKGLSYRAIARELGLNHNAVYKKLRALGLTGPVKSPEPRRMEPAAQTMKTDGLGELIEALRLLHQHGYKQACMILLQNARSFLEGEG